MKYTIVILVSTTTHWLRLSREDRNQYTITHIGPILAKYAPTVTLRMFDAEAFNARHTDFLIVETTDLKQYYHFWEEIRDSKIYTEPYFTINEIIVGREDAFKEFEETLK